MGELQDLAPSGYGELSRGDGSTVKGIWEKGDIDKGTIINSKNEVYTGQL